jgi:fermentation-respiration switch protein FrsA (DUF1100 family)
MLMPIESLATQAIHSKISPTPSLLVVAEGDHLVVVDLAIEAYEKALEPKKLLV